MSRLQRVMPMPAVFNVALNSPDILRSCSACARLVASLTRSASSVSARSLRVLLRRSSMLIAPCNVPPSQYCPQLTQAGPQGARRTGIHRAWYQGKPRWSKGCTGCLCRSQESSFLPHREAAIAPSARQKSFRRLAELLQEARQHFALPGPYSSSRGGLFLDLGRCPRRRIGPNICVGNVGRRCAARAPTRDTN